MAHLSQIVIAVAIAVMVWGVVISRIFGIKPFQKGDRIQRIADEKWHNHPILEVLEVGNKNYLVKVYGISRTKPFEILKSKTDKYRKVKTWNDVH